MMRRVSLMSHALLILCTAGWGFATGRSDVADAVMNGNHAGLRVLLQQKADVNAAQIDGATALHWAAYRDDMEAARLLISAGAKVDAANREGITPLYMASLYGNVELINALVNAGADAKQKGPHGETMVMLAARSGNAESIKSLLRAGADVNAREPVRGTTPLMWAVEQKHPAAVKALLDGGADHRAKSGPAGLPRNYMAQKVNTANVEAAMKRWSEAVKNGRTYEQQLAAEEASGKRVQRLLPDFSKDDLPAIAKFVIQATSFADVNTVLDFIRPQVAAAGKNVDELEKLVREQLSEANDSDVIVAGLVGKGGGGLTPMIFAARE